MSNFALTDAVILAGAYDLTGHSNSIEVNSEVDEKEVTTFGSGGARERIGGLKTASANVKGYFEAGVGYPDALLFPNLGVNDTVFTVVPDANDGSDGYFMQTLQADYSLGEAVGEVLAFEANALSRGIGLIRGTVLHPKGTARTSNGTGSGQQVGAIGATETLYAGLHVIQANGTTPSLTVKVQSDDNGSFTSATNQITFTAATDTTSEWKTLAGAVTDDYWRVTWTITGTGPSFKFLVIVGIV